MEDVLKVHGCHFALQGLVPGPLQIPKSAGVCILGKVHSSGSNLSTQLDFRLSLD